MIRQELKELYLDKRISNISYQLSKQLSEFETGDLNKELSALVTSVVATALEQGNVCVDLKKLHSLNGKKLTDLIPDCVEDDSLSREKVVSLSCVCESSDVIDKPLVIFGDLLYLNRSYSDEVAVSLLFGDNKLVDVDLKAAQATLSDLFNRPYSYLLDAILDGKKDLDTCYDILNVHCRDGLNDSKISSILDNAKSLGDLKALDELIPSKSIIDWQKVAVSTALVNRVAIISGGPGTGKTTTVCKLLAALIQLSLSGNDSKIAPIIKIAAPTGKAAARLTESISNTLASIDLDESVKKAIPTESSTLHRLLGATYGKSDYRFNKNNKLNLDILVVDEASMVDLKMMSRVSAALPTHARLILLGDKDQLSSVDAGSVLGDICDFYDQGQSDLLISQINEMTGFSLPQTGEPQSVADKICILQKSYRFHANSGIGVLAKNVNLGYFNKAISTFDLEFDDIQFHELNEANYSMLLSEITNAYHPYLEAVVRGDIQEALNCFNKSRLLCAVRKGDFGTEKNNQNIENLLTKQQKITPSHQAIWYSGRPIMITRNDYGLGLHNGDIGITMLDTDGSMKVYFEMQDGTVKGFLTSRIPDHELAYCMTTHKSQGSEFEHTYILMPPNQTQVSTRELIYTGITRAKKKLSLFLTKESFINSIKTKTLRNSGLKLHLKKEM